MISDNILTTLDIALTPKISLANYHLKSLVLAFLSAVSLGEKERHICKRHFKSFLLVIYYYISPIVVGSCRQQAIV